jgi:hypothetical protein
MSIGDKLPTNQLVWEANSPPVSGYWRQTPHTAKNTIRKSSILGNLHDLYRFFACLNRKKNFPCPSGKYFENFIFQFWPGNVLLKVSNFLKISWKSENFQK